MTHANIMQNVSKNKSRPKISHFGSFELLPNVVFECAVLKDERRVLIQKKMTKAIGFQGNTRNLRFDTFLKKIGLNYLIYKSKTESPFFEADMPNGGIAKCVSHEFFVDIVKAGTIAAHQGKLTKHQKHIGEQCIKLSNSLIGVGLTALIDEATGYQYRRAPDALKDLYSRLICETASDWERRFHPDYYNSLCKLFGFKYGNQHKPLPSIIGKITVEWVYGAVFPNEILIEIKSRKKSEKLHQWLTHDGGIKLLEKQISAITTIAQSSIDYKDFQARCSQVFPIAGKQTVMVFPSVPHAA